MVRMTHLRHLRRLCARPSLLALGLGTWALASCAQPPARPAAEPESQRLARELRAVIGPAACTADSQCRTLPVGAKACGGPAGYWAWSTEGTDAEKLVAVAQRQSTAQKREIEASGMSSDCRVITDPGAACVANRCELSNKPGNTAR